VHSAQEDNGDFIQITERLDNVFNHQLIFEKGNQDTNELTHYFNKTINKTRKNAIVEYLDYQIPVTQLMGALGNEDTQAAKGD